MNHLSSEMSAEVPEHKVAWVGLQPAAFALRHAKLIPDLQNTPFRSTALRTTIYGEGHPPKLASDDLRVDNRYSHGAN